MSRFLVTYGPDPHIWCMDCPGVARVADYYPHPQRPGAFKAVMRLHVCGPGPWDLQEETAHAYTG